MWCNGYVRNETKCGGWSQNETQSAVGQMRDDPAGLRAVRSRGSDPQARSGCQDFELIGGERPAEEVTTPSSAVREGRRNGFPVELVGGQRCHRGVMSIHEDFGAAQPAGGGRAAQRTCGQYRAGGAHLPKIAMHPAREASSCA